MIIMIPGGPTTYNNCLLFFDLLPEMPLTLSRLGVSLCPVDGAVEDRRFLTKVLKSPGSPMGHN